MNNPDNLPLLSVIIVVRNAAATIARTLDSLIAQHYPRLDLIVWDGLSDDGTTEILARYSHIITVMKCERDDGPQYAYNKAVALACGDYVSSLNADDEYMPGTLWAVADSIGRQPETDVVSFGMLYRKREKIIGYYADASQLEFFFRNIFCELPTFMLSRFIRRDVLASLMPLDVSYYYTNDRDLMARLALARPKNCIIDKALYIFDVDSGSLSNNVAHYGAMVKEHMHMADSMLARSDLSEDERQRVRRWRLHRLVFGFWIVLARGELQTAWLFLRQGISLGGWRWCILCKYLLAVKLLKRLGIKLSHGIDRGNV